MLSKLCLQPARRLFRVRSRLRARARSRPDNTECYPLDLTKSRSSTKSTFSRFTPRRRREAHLRPYHPIGKHNIAYVPLDSGGISFEETSPSRTPC
jgi:hypothetical protein